MKESTDTIFNSNLETRKISLHFLNVSSVVFWKLKQDAPKKYGFVIYGGTKNLFIHKMAARKIIQDARI